MDGKLLVEKLIVYAKTFLGLKDLDVVYYRNLLLHLFNLTSPLNEEVDLEYIKEYNVPDLLVEEIIAYSIENKIVKSQTEGDLFANYVLGILSPNPSEVNCTFTMLKESVGVQSACDYLYNLSIKNYYIRKSAIDKNVAWKAKELKIPLDITINLSKPEKSNKDVAKLLTAPTDNKYPNCPLCKENEGFYGSTSHPARTNIRTVTLNLGGEEWGMQYSPYSYFDEHCILFNKTHTPMKMDGTTIEKLLDFIEYFPNYFIGSNSDLPIVGGSILNHEHYQGGRYEMPLHKASALKTYKSLDYKDLTVEVLNFYNSVIRIVGFNRNTVQTLATEIVEKWKTYTDESLNIIANSNGVRHNTVTPIARFVDDQYCIELILRNNLTSQEYPDGIYHAHPEYHNIKKEGIGIIEAMGLYILPARLLRQFNEIENILVGKTPYDKDLINNPENDLYVHREMIEYLVNKNPNVKTQKTANKIITSYVNEVCSKILLNTAVFKKDSKGIAGFNKFLSTCNIK